MPPALPPRPSLRRGRRLRLPRRPAPYWILSVGLALLTGVVVNNLVGQAAAEVARYGETTAAVVVVRQVEAGSRLGAGDTELHQVPASLVPDGARRTTAAGEVALVDLHVGEVLLDTRLAPAGVSPTAALLPPGTRGVSVPTGSSALDLRRGDTVDVLVTVDPATTLDGEAGAVEPSFAVARRAPVIAVDEGGDAVTVAVTETEAPRVAFALSTGSVTLVLVGPTG